MGIIQPEIRKWLILAMLLLLSLLTMYLLVSVDRFHVANPQLLIDPQFQQGNRFWQESGSEQVTFDGESASILNSSGASHSISQNVKIDTPAYIQFSFTGSSNNVVPGSKEWARASGTIIYRDRQGDRVSSHMSAVLDGTIENKKYTHLELLREQLGSIDIVFRLLQAGGEFTVSDPVLSLLEEAPFYNKMKVIILVVWLGLLFWLSVTAYRMMSRKLLSLFMVLAIAVAIAVLMPQHLMVEITQKIAASTPHLFLSSTRTFLFQVFGINDLAGTGAEVSKLGHFAAFLLIGLLASRVSFQLGVIFTVAAISVFALLTESLQLLVVGRSPRVSDFALDVAGGVIGLLLGVCCHYIYAFTKHKFSEQPKQ